MNTNVNLPRLLSEADALLTNPHWNAERREKVALRVARARLELDGLLRELVAARRLVDLTAKLNMATKANPDPGIGAGMLNTLVLTANEALALRPPVAWRTFPMGAAAAERQRGLKATPHLSHAVAEPCHDHTKALCGVLTFSLCMDDSLATTELPDCPKCRAKCK
jgi:hypothetical protein